MTDTAKTVIIFIMELMDKEFSGELRLNFHKGDLSAKIHKTETLNLKGGDRELS
uniref:Uncharacterized protein n=1 Tax=viral metagenome TaxID=1070528 RepID=A0A6M3L4K0_9ZZZZ